VGEGGGEVLCLEGSLIQVLVTTLLSQWMAWKIALGTRIKNLEGKRAAASVSYSYGVI
jgi:hypothetical protein